MANPFALLSLAESLAKRLDNAYPDELRAAHSCAFNAIGSGGLLDDVTSDGQQATLTVWPHRITVNQQLRNTQAPASPGKRNRPLMLDVHLLLSVWSSVTGAELTVFGWMLRELHREPLLDASTLSSSGGWRADDVVQLIPAEMSVEDMARLWDSIKPSYRLSAPYVARIVTLDVEDDEAAPVLVRRFDYGRPDGRGSSQP